MAGAWISPLTTVKSLLLFFALSSTLFAAPALEKFSPAEVRSNADGGATVAAWFDGQHPQKIVLWVLLSSRERKETYTYSDDGRLVSVAIFERWFAIDDATGKLDPKLTERTTESGHHFDQMPSAAESAEDRVTRQKLGAWLYQQLLTKPRTLDLTSLTTGDTPPAKAEK
ncbi:MAG: hypothetical protein JWO82_3192 [Akkermansiaceae bacterium]|nr:hypothetical protein [Akkermansiaceae bacterium]